MTGLLVEGQIAEPLDKAVEIGARQIAVRGDLVTPRLLRDARKRDLQVVCWTVNHPAHMRLLVEAGVDGIISDYPDRLLELARRNDGAAGLHHEASARNSPPAGLRTILPPAPKCSDSFPQERVLVFSVRTPAQIVHQRLSFLCETWLHKLEELVLSCRCNLAFSPGSFIETSADPTSGGG